MNRLTDKQQREIQRLYGLGVQVKNIPQLVGATIGQVHRYIYKVMENPSRNRQANMSELRKIKELYLTGMSESEICDYLQMKRTRLRHLLKVSGERLRVWKCERV